MATAARTGESYESRFITAQDGLTLHVRLYGPATATALPVVCLPGLARTSADFHALACALSASDMPRRVAVLDYRGRGRSDYDRNWNNYVLPVELSDLAAVLAATELAPAVFVGTSRGGLLAMLFTTARPIAVAGIVLNDIGPVIEPKGLVRIRSYVGKLPTPRTFEEGADILRRLFSAQFPNLGPDEWVAYAKRTWKENKGTLVLDYDPNLGRMLDAADLERPIALWSQFDALAHVPVMVIRGANSDLLSAKTVAAMRERRHDLEVIEVADQGHAPLLSEPDLIRRIASFVDFCEISAGRKS